MIGRDLHCHTCFCDGKNTPEEMVQKAIEIGLSTIGISEHGYTAFDTSYCLSRDKTEEYKAEILRLKEKYSGKIEVLLGIELDALSDIDVSDFDYVIGSAHYVKCGSKYLSIDESPAEFEHICHECFGGDYYAFAEEYYRTVSLLATKKISIVGHLDLITKFNECNRLFDMENPRYLAATRGAVDALLPLDIPFEINTGAISRGYRTTPYPHTALAYYIKQKGGKLILSSDSHSAENLCFKFDEFENLL